MTEKQIADDVAKHNAKMAKKKEVKQIDIADLGLDLSAPQTELIGLEAVPERSQARMIEGSTRDMAVELVKILKEEEKVL